SESMSSVHVGESGAHGPLGTQTCRVFDILRRNRPSRMLIRELTNDECIEVLARNHLGHLGCARLDQPYVVPIHFSFDAAPLCAYAFSTVGQKVHWMRDNPKVCLEVAEVTDKQHWVTVVANGVYQDNKTTTDEAA